jgi:hypothetical protein
MPSEALLIKLLLERNAAKLLHNRCIKLTVTFISLPTAQAITIIEDT